ncbi:cinnamoyl-CoA reductase 1-like [Curcuma longa]|uniref:cinnamoyl-CoA reductase 1-like n=1 Tax=Curcuma longa TaxID=136217 RepID=UPI003D9E588F
MRSSFTFLLPKLPQGTRPRRRTCETSLADRLRLFQIDLLDPDSIIAAIRGCAGVFHLASPCTVDSVQNPQRELLDPAVKGTLNVLCTAKESGVCRVVVTSSISAIIPSPGWPADRVKDESCWTNLDYCRQKEAEKLRQKEELRA